MEIFKISKKLMGSAFELGIVANNKIQADHLLKIGIDEIERLEEKLSEFLPNSEVSKINNSDQLQTVSSECFDLIVRANQISKLTHGDFDITTKPLKSLYNFKNCEFTPPDKREIKKTLKSVGFQKLQLNRVDKSIRCSQKNMQISFAAIGKGYASDRVKKIWLDHHVKAGYINASGDLNAFGLKPDNQPWKVTIANPENPKQNLFKIPVTDMAVATSGNYFQYFTHNNKKYSHNLDPKTGIPLTKIKSVTIFSPSAELSDALATAVTVKGVKNGLNFINSLPNTHGIIIDDKDQTHFSNHINFHQYEI
ncbi:FAD:protein FMN transferase [Wenyingzhuangia sp. IMCC45533]